MCGGLGIVQKVCGGLGIVHTVCGGLGIVQIGCGGVGIVHTVKGGDGGHNVNSLVRAKAGQVVQEPSPGANVNYLESKPAVDARGLILKAFDDHNYGYLRISVDKQKLRIGFHNVGAGSLAQSRAD